MRDLNIKIKGVYIKEEGIRSIEKTNYGYLVDSISRGFIKTTDEDDIESINQYIISISKRKKLFSNKLLTY